MKNQSLPSEPLSDDESIQHRCDWSSVLNVKDKEFAQAIAQLPPHEASEKINARLGIRDDEVLPEPGPVPHLGQEEQLFEQLRKNAELFRNREKNKPD